jgi:hypothetical protein
MKVTTDATKGHSGGVAVEKPQVDTVEAMWNSE